MATGKGPGGETCAEAIRAFVEKQAPIAPGDIFQQVQKAASWKDETIWLHLMSLVVNLPPARRHWKRSKPFLFLRPDGRYELYDPRQHPIVIE